MSDDCVLPWLLVICLLAFIWDAWAREKFIGLLELLIERSAR